MKTLKTVLVCIAWLIPSLLFIGCSKEVTKETSPIVGTWYDSYTNGGTTECFYADGSWSREDRYYPMSGTYSFDEKSRVLLISITPSIHNGGGTNVYYVLALTSTNLSYTTDDGITHNFVRID